MLEKIKNSKLYHRFVKFINTLKPMTWKQRLEHIWMYYKEYLYILGIIIMALSLLVTIIKRQTEDVAVSGMAVNVIIKQEGYNYLSVDYQEYLGCAEKGQIVELDYTQFGDVMDATYGSDSLYASLILTSRVSGGLLDYMILDKFAMEYYITHEVYMDLRNFFTEEELAALAAENRVIYAQQDGQEDRWPIAIDITQIPYVKDNITSEDGKVYFALSGNTQKPEMCRNAWEYILAWESKAKE